MSTKAIDCYALVQFVDGTYYICPKVNIIEKEGKNTVSVKYKNGSRYEAHVCATSTDLESLRNIITGNEIAAKLNANDICDFSIPLERNDTCINMVHSSVHPIIPGNEIDAKSNANGVYEYDDNDDDSIKDPDYIPDEEQLGDENEIDMESEDSERNDVFHPEDNEEVFERADLDTEKLLKCIEENDQENPGQNEVFHPDDSESVFQSADLNAEKLPKCLEEIDQENLGIFNNEINTSEICDVINPAILSGTSKRKKQYFCLYCQKLIRKFARHIETVHRNEEKVKLINSLPKGSTKRFAIINNLRKKSCFIFNTKQHYNKGYLMLTRQPQDKFEKTSQDFKVCPQCRGFYSKQSIRRHYLLCSKEVNRGERNLSVLSRKVHKQIHEKANDVLKYNIFPVLHEDEIVTIIRYDELAIIYGNKLTLKYRDQHHYAMIRNRLRLIGRFLIEIKKINNRITDFASVFNPLHYDSVISAVNNVANFNAISLKYKSPATAFSLGTLLKKTGKIAINESIKNSDFERQKSIENFLHILEEDFNYSVNKTVQENQLEMKRRKNVILPSCDDIILLNKYLKLNREQNLNILEKSFNFQAWEELSKYSLVSAQVFNRRRPGEIERILISDFNKYESIDENTDTEIFKSLSVDAQNSAKKYVRFTIRGKLARGVPVILHKDLLKCIQLILDYRKEAGVPEDNPYIFGIPGNTGGVHKYLRACNLLRKFSEECGATNPNLLRATELRKQIATRSILLNLEENEISDLARHLGHEKKIHEDHYRLPIVTRDLARISRLLEIAQGDVSKTDDSNNIEFFLENEKSRPNSFNELEGQTNEEPMKKRRSSSPRGRVKRVSWENEAIRIASTEFKEHIQNRTLPSLSDCQDVINNHPELQNRSPVQLKSWVSNQFKISPSTTTKKRKRENTIYWTEQEKTIMRSIFSDNIKTKKLPDFNKCEEAISKHPELKYRSRETVKAWVYNEIKRNKKNVT